MSNISKLFLEHGATVQKSLAVIGLLLLLVDADTKLSNMILPRSDPDPNRPTCPTTAKTHDSAPFDQKT